VSSTALGLALALAASVALNASYLLQHRGAAHAPAVSPRHPVATLRALLRSPWWAVGALVGLTGWALHVGALARAPLSLVQAFVAGGLALAAPMAALGLGHRLEAAERRAMALMVLALPLLTLGLGHPGRAAGFAPAALGGAVLALGALAALLAAGAGGVNRAPALGLAGGLLYGAADLAVKALTGLGGAAWTSPWLLVAGGATAGAFFAFQRGLQTGRPVAVIALMTAGTNAGSVLGAFLVFGDPLGRTPPLAAAHLAAFGLVAVAAWWLAPSQARLAA
jgi:hypothetical protein